MSLPTGQNQARDAVPRVLRAPCVALIAACFAVAAVFAAQGTTATATAQETTAPQADPTPSEELTVTSWGGAYLQSQKKAYGAPWEKKSGNRINWGTYVGDLAEIRRQVREKKIRWDVVDVLPDAARIGCDEGLFEKLPSGTLAPGAGGESIDDDLLVKRPNDCVAPLVFWSYVTFFDPATFKDKEAPKTIADFFDVEKYPGKRGIHTWPNALVEMALVADGVPVRDVYKVMATDEGIDRAFAKLDTIRDHVVFWSSGARPLDLVRKKEVVMSVAYNGHVGAAVLSEGAPFETIWDGQVLEEEWLVVVKGTPRKAAALDFVSFATAPERQADQARHINYGPMRKSAFQLIARGEPWFHNGKNIMPHMPNRNDVIDRSVFADPVWWQRNGDKMRARFKAWRDRSAR
ncbi:MAG: ABC transporter substrate-binding protein [Pseudomonadota bacterium]